VRRVNVVVRPSVGAVAEHVADLLARRLAEPGPFVLGVAAGRTPTPIYRALCSRRPPTAGLWLVLLDEYVGLAWDDPRSFARQIVAELVEPLGLDRSRLAALDGTAADPDAECTRFEEAIVALGGVDVQLLGIGRNGHIAFDEPGTPHGSRTHRVGLTESTRQANAAAFGGAEAVPAEALTQGIGTILDARRLVLVATGAGKAAAVAATVDGPVTEAVPASALQAHRDVTIVLDAAAASELRR